MAITVKHKFVSAIPDAGDTTIVQPSNWNDDHQLVGTVPVANGGTGASTLTGYVVGNGTAAMTASTTIPSTDVTGLGTMSTQNANAIAVTGGTMSGVTVTGYIPTTEKAVANGVATLDGGGTVPVSQLPAAVLGALSYQGTWNASTNTPTLTSSVGTKGYYYVVNVAGSTNLNGITDWQVGDWAVYNGTAWQKIDNTDAVTSVNGYTGTVVLGYGDITTGVVPVVNGGTGVTVSSGANSVVLRDANVNINANALDDGYSNIAASGTPIVLTTASVRRFTITGSGGQTIKLPDATTLTSGAIFQFDNNQSSGAITVNNNSNTLIVSVPSGGFVLVNLLSNATAAGSWDRHDQAPSNVSWSTNTFDYAGSFTSGTWNGNAVAYNRGGTGQSSAFTAGGIVYGSTTSALAVTSIGTTGQVLTSAGAGTPTWTTPTTGTVTSVTGTSPVVSSGGATPAISMPAATTSVNGYLTSTDWTTFNNKGSGTVTSVSATVPSFLSVSGSPITTSGTLALTYSGTALPILNGGTGQTTASAAFNALSPLTTAGDTLYGGTSGAGTRLAIGTAGQVLTVNAGATAPQWSTPTTGTVTSVSGTTGRITSTGGNTPVIDLASGVATAGTTGSASLIPVVTIDTYGRVTSITTAANPQGTVTSVTGTAPVVSSGGATPAISMAAANTTTNGYLTSTDWNTFNGKGSGTVTSVAALTLGTTGTDLSSTVATGTTTPVITLQVPTASATNRGALSSTDWSTFNGKAPAVTYTTNYVPFGQGTTTPNLSASFTYVTGTGSLTAPQVVASNGIVVNNCTIATTYAIPTGYSATSAGPITISSGVSVTVPTGGKWVVL